MSCGVEAMVEPQLTILPDDLHFFNRSFMCLAPTLHRWTGLMQRHPLLKLCSHKLHEKQTVKI